MNRFAGNGEYVASRTGHAQRLAEPASTMNAIDNIWLMMYIGGVNPGNGSGCRNRVMYQGISDLWDDEGLWLWARAEHLMTGENRRTHAGESRVIQ